MSVNCIANGVGIQFGSRHSGDIYWEGFDRNSIDDHGMPLSYTVHYLEGSYNASWNGQDMVYADGDDDFLEIKRLWRFNFNLRR